MSTFTGKAVLVTGAGTGIGYALCQAFASVGATVGLNDINPMLCQRSAQQINQTLGVERVYPYVCDVADVQAVRTMFHRFVDMARASGPVTFELQNGLIVLRGTRRILVRSARNSSGGWKRPAPLATGLISAG